MRSRFLKRAVLLSGAAWMALSASSAFGQSRILGHPQPTYCPPQPCLPAPLPRVVQPPAVTPGQPQPPQQPQPQQPQAPDTMPQDTGTSPEASQAAGGETFAGLMMGDQLSIPALAFSRRGAGSSSRSGSGITPPPVPSVRSFKIADNESPRPLDRVYMTFHYFDNVNDAANGRLNNGVRNVDAFREAFGLEKTFLDRRASVGLRIPLNHLTADGPAGIDRSSTDIGDLTVIGKYAFWQDPCTGSLLSAGLAATFPTGPSNFADSSLVNTPVHTTVLQPYVGFIWNRERFYVHGFSGVQVPLDSDDVLLMSNDIGVGYRLYRSSSCDCGRLITSITPTLEVHVNTPLNHRGGLDFSDPSGTPDFIDVTSGVTIGLGNRASLALGIVIPVTGPKPFDFEVLAQFNWRFGPSAAASTGNILGN